MLVKTILITGGSGLIGRAFTTALLNEGHCVHWLSTSGQTAPAGVKVFNWNPESGEIDSGAFIGVSVIVNMAGAGLFNHRWTNSYKHVILSSRISAVRLIRKTLGELNIIPDLFIGLSATGFYGNGISETPHTEFDTGGEGFLAEVCMAWEHEYNLMASHFHRSCILRVGMVLTPQGGALKKLMAITRLGLAGPLASGKQIYPWIHIDDFLSLLFMCLSDERYTGVFNAVAPDTISQRQFSRALSSVMRKPCFMPPIPGFILKILLGKMCVMITDGRAVAPLGLTGMGFSFQFPNLKMALENLLLNSRYR